MSNVAGNIGLDPNSPQFQNAERVPIDRRPTSLTEPPSREAVGRPLRRGAVFVRARFDFVIDVVQIIGFGVVRGSGFDGPNMVYCHRRVATVLRQ